MKKGLILILVFAYFAINELHASECDKYNSVDLNEGDVVSADLLKDIFTRIEGVSIGLTPDDLNGVWVCESFNKNSENLVNGYTANLDGFGSSMSQDVTFTKQANDTFIVTYANNLGQNITATSANTCRGKLLKGALFIMEEEEGGTCFNVGLYGMRKISKQCFTWEVTNSFPAAGSTECSRKSSVSVAPKDLQVTQSDGVASLTWTAGDAAETGYDVQRKTSINGTYASIGTPTAESYDDSSIARGNSYWYRVFAINSNGTSEGSNVIRINYANTPPSMNLSSTISVNEGTTSVVTVGATDADGDSLSYSISNSNASTDAEELSVNSAGVISFDRPPDWEIPTDYNTDNIYDIKVLVSDGTSTVSQDISVVVLDVDGS